MQLCEQFNLDFEKPLIIFIGRLVGEKGADLLPQVISDSFAYIGRKMNFLVLGSGEPVVERGLLDLQAMSQYDYNVFVGYNETLSHVMYAGADFLLMPSRVEPCGLNQMYAMRYGTIPMVRRTGGLRDTVLDFGDTGGYGICYDYASVGDISHGVFRAVELFRDRKKLNTLRGRVMQLDFSWERSVKEYITVYESIIRK
jgi:starch synthase